MDRGGLLPSVVHPGPGDSVSGNAVDGVAARARRHTVAGLARDAGAPRRIAHIPGLQVDHTDLFSGCLYGGHVRWRALSEFARDVSRLLEAIVDDGPGDHHGFSGGLPARVRHDWTRLGQRKPVLRAKARARGGCPRLV